MEKEKLEKQMLERQMLESLGYIINARTFADVKKYFSKDYLENRFNYQDNSVVYSGAEHSGKPKLPNLTILPHLKVSDGFILGSTMGHTHTENDNRLFQEIYEFQNYGAMLIQDLGKARLYVLGKGEKVVVGSRENMTIFNFSEEPLITLDYANPLRNQANKELEERIKTLLMIGYELQKAKVTFKINHNYIEEGIIKPAEALEVSFQAKLGGELYQVLKEQGVEEMKKLGIELFFGGNASEFREPLLELVLKQDEKLFRALGLERNNDFLTKMVENYTSDLPTINS